jgi:hypothetical protein
MIDKEKHIEAIKKYWEYLNPFENPDDVPDIPVVDEKEYKTFFIPRLIELGAIPKRNLIDGQVYIGEHRRCTRARWNAVENKFKYWRFKFGWFEDMCNHFEDDDGYALFVPIKVDANQDFKKPEN